MNQKQKTGKWGEDIATTYLEKKGYKIRIRNFIFERAEIDIIAEKNDELVIVEVKTRSSDQYGSPADFLSKRQQNQIINAAEGYIIQNEIDLDTRFDLIVILFENQNYSINHIEEAFFPE